MISEFALSVRAMQLEQFHRPMPFVATTPGRTVLEFGGGLSVELELSTRTSITKSIARREMRSVSVVHLLLLLGALLGGISAQKNPLAADEDVVNATSTIAENVSELQGSIETLKNNFPTTDYLKMGTQGFLDYVSNVSSKFIPVFENFDQNNPEKVQQKLIEAIRYLNGYEVINSITLMQNLDYNLYNHNQFRSINSDLRISSIAFSEAMFDQRDVGPALDDLQATTDKLLENVVRLTKLIQRGEAWTMETSSRASAAQQSFNESIDNYVNSSSTMILDVTDTLNNLRSFEEELYQKMKERIQLLPKSTVNYMIALKKTLENMIQKVSMSFENLRLYKHREIEHWKLRSFFTAPISYMTQVAVQVSADPMLSTDCTEAYIEKLLAFPNFTISHVNSCLADQIANEEKTFELVSSVIENYVATAINASYAAFDICYRYAPKKLNYCLELNGFENTWANGRILSASRQIETFVDSEIQSNFNTCIAQIGYFLNYHNLQEMCFYNKKRFRPRGRW
ncbi:uncharacterized protein LOC129740987 [Uranotaenia lowii]|uniref:uncharacterized protein LOC129740987 n=1 Tax=Uranotaenia lowii TaxID=190385 RepID=UPI00247B274C|nr:uncharacterized protein LOC129740987 [Uranotaenia lowii]